MPNPFFMSGVQFVDNLWIKDRTHFSDLKLNNENAQLSMMLSGLHNFTFNSFNTMPQMDMGMLLGTFWNNAFNQANAELSMMFANFPQMGNFQMPAFAPRAEVSSGSSTRVSTTRPTAPEDMSEADKKTFEEKCDKFEDVVDEYSVLTSDDLKKLGVDSKKLEKLRERFSKADSATKIDELIADYKKVFENISDEKLKKYLAVEGEDNSAVGLHNMSKSALKSIESMVKVKDQVCDSNLNSNSIIGLDTKHLNSTEKTLLIENLLSLEVPGNGWGGTDKQEADALKSTIYYVVDAIRARANKKEVKCPEVNVASAALADAVEKAYKNDEGKDILDPDKDKKTAIVKAYKDLYAKIRIAEAQNKDKDNMKNIEDGTLPVVIKEQFLDNEDLKPEFKVNEIAVREELKAYNLEVALLDKTDEAGNVAEEAGDAEDGNPTGAETTLMATCVEKPKEEPKKSFWETLTTPWSDRKNQFDF